MSFEQSLKGGHPNSLGNTLEVVDTVLGNTDKMEDLFLCYQSDDETVRLRTSNAFKRIFRAKPDLFNKWKQRFIKEVAEIDQPSAKWTSIQVFNELFDQMDEKEKTQSVEICLRYLRNEEDWIVINQSLNFMRNHLERFDFKDPEMMKLLKNFVNDERKSISKNADILELGVPHNTPVADGSQIQTSSYRAIKNGIKMSDIFKIVKDFKNRIKISQLY